jgi:hypothetical protein
MKPSNFKSLADDALTIVAKGQKEDQGGLAGVLGIARHLRDLIPWAASRWRWQVNLGAAAGAVELRPIGGGACVAMGEAANYFKRAGYA